MRDVKKGVLGFILLQETAHDMSGRLNRIADLRLSLVFFELS